MNTMPGLKWFEIVLIFFPLLAGILVFLLNKESINIITEKVESWFRKKKDKSAEKQGLFSRFVIRPFLTVIVKLCDWTDSLSHRGLKNGIRIALSLYFLALWIYLLYVAFIVIAAIAIMIGVLIILFKILTGSESEPPDDSLPRYTNRTVQEDKENIMSSVGIRGKKIYQGTSWFNEEMKGRIDDDGIIYKGASWLNEERIGRIDENGSIYKGTNFFNEVKIGHIEENGTVFKGSNWFNEEMAGRIVEDGNIYKGSSKMNEAKQGRAGD